MHLAILLKNKKHVNPDPISSFSTSAPCSRTHFSSLGNRHPSLIPMETPDFLLGYPVTVWIDVESRKGQRHLPLQGVQESSSTRCTRSTSGVVVGRRSGFNIVLPRFLHPLRPLPLSTRSCILRLCTIRFLFSVEKALVVLNSRMLNGSETGTSRD